MINRSVYKPDKAGLELSKKICFELLLIVDKICKEKGLKYWLDGGTLLAARRHKGFIPWDDDIDICLEYSEYENLIQELAFFCEKNSKYILFHSDSSLKYCHDFFGNIEYLRDGLTPVRIDIIPVKIIPDQQKLIERDKSLANIYSYYFQGYFKSREEVLEEHYHLLPDSIKNSIKKRAEFITYYSSYMRELISSAQTPVSKKLINYSFNDAKVQKRRPYYEFEDVFPLGEIEFEGKKFPSPHNIHNYLRILYGEDYISPPPLASRKSHFQRLYRSNIQKDEIKKLLDYFYFYGYLNLYLPLSEYKIRKKLNLVKNFFLLNWKLLFTPGLLLPLYRYAFFKLQR